MKAGATGAARPARRVRSVPPALLSGCAALATLCLHDNPITVEELRETPGAPLTFDL